MGARPSRVTDVRLRPLAEADLVERSEYYRSASRRVRVLMSGIAIS